MKFSAILAFAFAALVLIALAFAVEANSAEQPPLDPIARAQLDAAVLH